LHGQVNVVDGRNIHREQLNDASVLLVRSVSRVDKDLLDGTGVRFVGSATIGTDHLNTDWMEQAGITWASAPGCNADAAAQYALALIWESCHRLKRNPLVQTVGIIGFGNVGSRLGMLLDALGIESVACDPPLAETGKKGLVSLEKALSRSVVSLHVPLTKDSPYPSYEMIGAKQLAMLGENALLVNTSRGKVIDYPDLMRALESDRIYTAFDVWPEEPGISPDLLHQCTLGTPHVAGYSHEGKVNGTLAVYQAFRQWLGLEAVAAETSAFRPVELTVSNRPDWIGDLLDIVCSVASDDKALRSNIKSFDEIRRNYALRHDFSSYKITGADHSQRKILDKLGFS
jgi:erythronate-4-phosphate dehydrogenase